MFVLNNVAFHEIRRTNKWVFTQYHAFPETLFIHVCVRIATINVWNWIGSAFFLFNWSLKLVSDFTMFFTIFYSAKSEDKARRRNLDEQFSKNIKLLYPKRLWHVFEKNLNVLFQSEAYTYKIVLYLFNLRHDCITVIKPATWQQCFDNTIKNLWSRRLPCPRLSN